jgi:tRNA A-37 threonylcarbamoyl transferase component Bud32
MPARALAIATDRCEISPEHAGWLCDLGLQSARDFLTLPGVVVSGHVGRNVSRVQLGERVGYLKREHRVRLRDRWRSLLAGFGPSSLSQREAIVLGRLRKYRLPGPTFLAWGEAEDQAFLFVEEAAEAIDLRCSTVPAELAAQLGRITAGIHNAGIDQPDLFAKHFLVNFETGQITILDWQRARLGPVVPWRKRIRSLAALRATISEEVMSGEIWDCLLDAYLEAVVDQPAAQTRTPTMSLLALRAGVDNLAFALRRQPAIRSQLKPPAANQELIRIGGERVCAIPEIARELDQPDVIASLYDPANNARPLRFRNGSTGILHVSRYRSPLSRWWAAIRGKAWRSHELKAARLLFHLDRHGIAAPRLLAYGQQVNHIVDAGSFILAEPRDARLIASGDADLIRPMLAKLHESGCCLRGNSQPFGVEGDAAVVADIRFVRLNRRLSARQKDRDAARLYALLGGSR